jgi:DNA-binding response OmpR family regulator
MRISLLEDDPDHGAQLQALLEGGGHHVHLFTRGRPLLNRLAQESFDVIVLDWVVPDVSGFDVLRTIRSQTVSDTPVLFLSHRDSEGDVVAALEAGADDFLVEPARDGVPVELTPREFDVAVFFFRNPGKLVSRAHLMEVL